MCSYSTAQCTDRQSFWGRLLKLKNKPFLFISFFVLLNCLYVFLSFFIFFYTNVWHSKKTEHRYYMSICSNEVEMVIKNNGWKKKNTDDSYILVKETSITALKQTNTNPRKKTTQKTKIKWYFDLYLHRRCALKLIVLFGCSHISSPPLSILQSIKGMFRFNTS